MLLVGATGRRARDNSNSRRCGQGVQVGLRYTGQILIEVDETTLRVYDQCERLIKTVPRTSRKAVRGHKDYGHTTNHKTARHCHPVFQTSDQTSTEPDMHPKVGTRHICPTTPSTRQHESRMCQEQYIRLG